MSEETGKGPGELNEVKELKELVAALRDSIMELKAALNDVSNPFLEEPRPPRSQGTGPPNGAVAQQEKRGEVEAPETQGAGEGAEGEPGEAAPSTPRVIRVDKPAVPPSGEGDEGMLVPLSASTQLHPVASAPVAAGAAAAGEAGGGGAGGGVATAAARRAAWPVSGVADLKKTLRILRVMYRLARKLPSESLEHYIELMRTLGLVDDRTARTVEILKSLVEVSKREGLTPEDHVIALYSLAKMLGVQDRELEEEVAMIMVEKLRGARRDANPGSGGEDSAEEDEGGGSQWGLPLQ